MSTNKMTKKYDMISRQKGVALLIHDFADEGGDDRLTGEFSISKYPRLCIVFLVTILLSRTDNLIETIQQ